MKTKHTTSAEQFYFVDYHFAAFTIGWFHRQEKKSRKELNGVMAEDDKDSGILRRLKEASPVLEFYL